MKTKSSLAPRLLLASLLAVSASAFGAAFFTPNDQPTGWVGEVDVSNFNFASGIEVIFKGDYVRGSWTGNLFAFPVDVDGTVLFDAERWSGGVAPGIDAANYDSGRRIVTMKKDGTKIPFRWASLDDTQKSKLGDNTKGPKVLNYIRGDHSNEDPSGEKYRPRTSVMGAIIHSRPLFVDHPTDPRVYVGANDGMLHSFDADTGDEVFAYIPSFFIEPKQEDRFSHIAELVKIESNPDVHNHYVDGSPNARKVNISGATRTILVGGLGAGGKGLYALDITDPTAATEDAAASKILWEITPVSVNNATNTSYADLGYTYGIPVIAKLNDGTWAAIVGNGYNNREAKKAVLYVINLATGAKIAGIATSDANQNGLSTPSAVDIDRDGKVDYVYAGDINGNLWKFDIRNVSSPVVTKLFTTSPAQPITGRPSVSLNPNGGYMITFGTGRMFTSADATDSTTVYYAYGIWDNGTTIDPAKIVGQTLTAKSWSSGGFNYNVRVSSSNAVTYTGTTPNQGWKLALPAGERVVGDGGLVTNSRYVFTSTNPTVAHAAVDGVAQPKGDNWLNEVDFLTGGGGTKPIFDLDANLVVDDLDRVAASSGTGTQAGPSGIPVSRYISAGVLSQPIVAQLDVLSQPYFNTNPDAIATSTSSTEPGVSGGHFDFDIYYGLCTVGETSYKCGKNVHVHEYDDKYNVTGVDMLNASLANFNLVNAIPSTLTDFKILVSNQRFNPAATFLVGGNPGVSVTSYQTTAGLTMASLTSYTRATIGTLIFALPLDAFQSKPWAGGEVRPGLMPTQTGCVHGNDGGGTTETGLWQNGALTWQIVKANTPDSAVELNVPGDPTMGYRLKKDATSQGYQLAMYATFWHHPNGKCHGVAAWVQNPPQDTDGSSTSFSARAPGSTDPKEGLFGTGGTVGSGGGTGGGAAGPSTTVTYTFADGSSMTQTTVRNPDGSYTVTRVYSTDGRTETRNICPTCGPLQDDNRSKSGRVSWREMIRP